MKNSTSLFRFTVFGILLITLQGCASLKNKQDDFDEGPVSTVIYHTVASGDRLSDIALRYTGVATRWETIAAFNEIENPHSLRIGEVVAIPRSLIPDNLLPMRAKKEGFLQDNNKPVKVAKSTKTRPNIATTTANTMAVKRAAKSNTGSADVVVHPVSINRTFELSPIGSGDHEFKRSSSSAAPQVKVVGTYYPKGIYQQPASYSNLMMRVAPGSMFELEREVNDWYKIITKDGIGYLRAKDGVIVTENQQ